jgi:hypothetical protein
VLSLFLSPQSSGMDPPAFSEISISPEFDEEVATPPMYSGSSSRQLVERRYMLGKESKPWLTLVLPSKANTSDDLPYFFGHAPIVGRVELDLTTPQHFLGFELQVKYIVMQ